MRHLSVKFMVAIVKVLDGKFGNKVLKQPYRNYYRVVVWTTLVALIWEYLLVPFFGWLDKVIYVMNHLIWG